MRRARNLLLAMALGSLAIASACSAKKNTELMVAVQTDMRIPKDLNAVTIRVISFGANQFEKTYEVGPSGLHLPATIGVVPNDANNLQPVDIQIEGLFGQPGQPLDKYVSHVIRKARVTFAKEKVALVRMPLRFTCYDNDCPEGQTCIAGSCQAVPELNAAELPEYSAEEVFGSGGDESKSGECWNAESCLAASRPLMRVGHCQYALGGSTKPDGGIVADGGSSGGDDAGTPPPMLDGGSSGADASPSFPDAGKMPFKAFDEKNLTVAIVSDKGLGFCSGGVCRVPLDFDEQEGWSWADPTHTTIKIADSFCNDSLRLEATDACATKTASVPFCDGNGSANDAGSDASTCNPMSCDGRCGPVDDGCGGKIDCPCSTDGGTDGTAPPDASPMVAGLEMVGVMPVDVGMSIPIRARAHLADGGVSDVTMMAKWTVTDIAIAAYDPATGMLHGNSPGFTVLAVTYMGASAMSDVVVNGTSKDAGADGCAPKSCAIFGYMCGVAPDGCGGTLDCGICGGGMSCIANKCTPTGTDAGADGGGCTFPFTMCGPSCVDTTSDPANCGGCFKPCGSGTTCSGSACVPTGGGCVKKTCGDYPGSCGPQSDGCGGVTTTCGGCTVPATCGGGGPSKCGTGACTPMTCAAAGATCGMVADGCGGTIMCGSCTAPATCGGGGVPNKCGGGGTGDAGTDADAGGDPCGTVPGVTAPLLGGWHLDSSTSPIAGPPLTPSATPPMSGGPGATSGSCSFASSYNFVSSSSEYFTATLAGLPSATGEIDVSAWVYIDTSTPPALGSAVVSSMTGAGGFFLGADATTGRPSFKVTLADGSTQQAVATTSVTTGWHQFVGQAKSGGLVRLYVDGAPVPPTGSPVTTLKQNPDLAIGRNLSGGNYWNGPIAEVRVYGK